MKVTIKQKAETQERVTLRVPASLKKRMNQTLALAESIGADYYASIVDIVDAGDQELRAKLIQAGAKAGDKSGDRSGDNFGDRFSTSNGKSQAEHRADK
jgi:hypothetical protein